MDLNATSFIVLGLLRLGGPCTPYELKQRVAGSLGNFWSVPHSRLYAEPERLAAGGYVSVDAEADGRRRKRYALTPSGEQALDAWVADPPAQLAELRNPALLALFFEAAPAAVAAAQLPLHEAKLAEYEALAAVADANVGPDDPRGPRLALEAGIRHEREWISFWRELVG